jgi:LysM repeat protein
MKSKKAIIIFTALTLFVFWFSLTSLAHSAGSGQAQEPIVCESEYTVQAGDWLSKIAEKYYGDVLAYPAIVIAANVDTGDTYTDIVDPDLIEPGWVLCIPSGEDMAQLMAMSVGTAPAGLAPADLTNATYRGIYEQPVTLTNGTYEGEPFVEGDASRPTISFIPDLVVYGDVTGDGQNDAAVLLVENSGGSATFNFALPR